MAHRHAMAMMAAAVATAAAAAAAAGGKDGSGAEISEGSCPRSLGVVEDDDLWVSVTANHSRRPHAHSVPVPLHVLSGREKLLYDAACRAQLLIFAL